MLLCLNFHYVNNHAGWKIYTSKKTRNVYILTVLTKLRVESNQIKSSNRILEERQKLAYSHCTDDLLWQATPSRKTEVWLAGLRINSKRLIEVRGKSSMINLPLYIPARSSEHARLVRCSTRGHRVVGTEALRTH